MDKTKDFNDFDEMVSAHRVVLKSLIDKDGYYKNAEASEINNGFGKQLNVMKLKLEAYKVLKEVPDREELFLSKKTKKEKNG
tara:strand:+ start:2497 stop:2742 length:246 start_codon:yes stop_codon:yes gene_type:complete